MLCNCVYITISVDFSLFGRSLCIDEKYLSKIQCRGKKFPYLPLRELWATLISICTHLKNAMCELLKYTLNIEHFSENSYIHRNIFGCMFGLCVDVYVMCNRYVWLCGLILLSPAKICMCLPITKLSTECEYFRMFSKSNNKVDIELYVLIWLVKKSTDVNDILMLPCNRNVMTKCAQNTVH